MGLEHLTVGTTTQNFTGNKTLGVDSFLLKFTSTSDANFFSIQGDATYSRIGIGGNPTSKFSVFSTIDETVVNIKAHTTQNNPLLNLQNNAGTQVFSMYATGLVNSSTDLRFNINTAGTNLTFEKSGVPFIKCFSTNFNTTIGSASVPNASTSLLLSQTDRAMILNKVAGATAVGLTAVDGMVLYVTSISGVFTSVGVWARENGVWVKL